MNIFEQRKIMRKERISKEEEERRLQQEKFNEDLNNIKYKIDIQSILNSFSQGDDYYIFEVLEKDFTKEEYLVFNERHRYCRQMDTIVYIKT